MQHGVLIDDAVRTKDLEFATKMGKTFQASSNWVLHFKKRHGNDDHGEGGSADHIYVVIAQAGIPKLLRNCNVNPYDLYNMDETTLLYQGQVWEHPLERVMLLQRICLHLSCV